MKRNEFHKIGSLVLNGKRAAILEHKHLAYFKIGGCNIPAQTKDEAIEKFKECQEKRAIKQEQI